MKQVMLELSQSQGMVVDYYLPLFWDFHRAATAFRLGLEGQKRQLMDLQYITYRYTSDIHYL